MPHAPSLHPFAPPTTGAPGALLGLGATMLLLFWALALCASFPVFTPVAPTVRPVVAPPLANYNAERETHALAPNGNAPTVHLAELDRATTCVCTNAGGCAHPQGHARAGHRETHLSVARQQKQFTPDDGWSCQNALWN